MKDVNMPNLECYPDWGREKTWYSNGSMWDDHTIILNIDQEQDLHLAIATKEDRIKIDSNLSRTDIDRSCSLPDLSRYLGIWQMCQIWQNLARDQK